MIEDSPFVAAAPVLVPMPAERPYTYAVPAGMRVDSSATTSGGCTGGS